jgi:hypothetical protein
MTFFGAALALAWIAIILLAFAMAALLRQQKLGGTTTHSVFNLGLGVGQRSPLDVRGSGTGQFIFLATTDCITCQQVMPEFGRLATDDTTDVEYVALLPIADRDWAQAYAAELGVTQRVRIEANPHAFEAFNPRLVPAIVAVGPTGIVVDAQPAGSTERLRAFVSAHTHAANRAATAPEQVVVATQRERLEGNDRR